MRRSILLAILFICVTGTAVSAETYYVRPGSGHGIGDGTSYANAFSDFDGVLWGELAGQLGAGDTLTVCGTFTAMPLQAKASGAVDRPITIDGDCSAHGEPAMSMIDATVNHLNASTQLLTNRWEWGPGATNIGYRHLAFRNLITVMEAGVGITRGGIKINATSAPGVVDRTADTFVTLDNVRVYTVGQLADELQDCVNGRGSHTRITNSYIHDCSHDAVYWEGNFNEFDHNIIARPDRKLGLPGGDNIQFGGAVGIQNTGNWIHHNTLDHSNRSSKQALILSGDSDLPIFNTVEDNLMIGGAFVLNFNPSGGVVRRNVLIGMNGTTRVLNVENQIGTNLGANVVTAYDNAIIGSTTTTQFGAFSTMPAPAIPYEIDLYRNSIVGFTDTGIRAFANSLSVRAYQNLVYSPVGLFAFSFGSGVTVKGDYNTWFGPANKWQGGGATDTSTHDQHTNPQFIAMPNLSETAGVPSPSYGGLEYYNVTVPRVDLRTSMPSPPWGGW